MQAEGQELCFSCGLVPATASFFKGAKLLIAADCTAYAYAAFHRDFMRGKVTIVGCPKLDPVDYSEKLTEIIRENDIKSVTIVRLPYVCICIRSGESHEFSCIFCQSQAQTHLDP